MTLPADGHADHRRSSADKIPEPEVGSSAATNSPYNLEYQNTRPQMSVLPALDSNFAALQERRRHQHGISLFRSRTREFWAEFFGTAILVLFGTGVNHQVTLGGSSNVTANSRGDWTTVSFGWGVAVMLGVVVSGGISGGHINPAVTLTLALLRGFSWKKVPIYWLAQFTGAFFGASLVYLNYHRAISLFEGGPGIRTVAGTGGLFFTNPLSYMSNLGCFFNEFLMTAILMMFICAVGDKGNLAPPKGLSPFVILWVVFGLASTLGMQTSFALNPARDLGPRLLTWVAGYGSGVWRIRSGYWFWCATLGPVCGCFVGCFLYDCFVGTESVESPLHNAKMTNWVRKVRGLDPIPDPEAPNVAKGVDEAD
ncbi:hypothetical protein O181_029234 [Austropuccinia psidii MF-1]|uniref:Aquaporin n=1 Tax=Austropuccinia psidii MF-1 TaxID=1389203 RepID=A0A9Q3H4D4_9BASI|nr:hypothetical protein [Austropuccinia psidii MF-1]